MNTKQKREYLRQRYNGVYRGVHGDDMKDSQVNAIYNNIVNRKESDSNVVHIPQYIRTKPSIVYVNGEKYMLKDNGEYELIEYDYE